MTTKLWENEYQKQETLSGFVDREIHLCVSHLMSTILPTMMEDGDYQDEAMALLYGRTHFVPWRDTTEGDEFDTEGEAQEWIDNHTDGEGWEIEERNDEILEHWAVSGWMGERLKEQGHAVEEICNVTVWGRCCSGQAIHLDGVIADIYEEMMNR